MCKLRKFFGRLLVKLDKLLCSISHPFYQIFCNHLEMHEKWAFEFRLIAKRFLLLKNAESWVPSYGTDSFKWAWVRSDTKNGGTLPLLMEEAVIAACSFRRGQSIKLVLHKMAKKFCSFLYWITYFCAIRLTLLWCSSLKCAVANFTPLWYCIQSGKHI